MIQTHRSNAGTLHQENVGPVRNRVVMNWLFIFASIVAFLVSLALRIGGGEPLFGVPPVIPYPEIFGSVLPLEPANWYDAETGALLFPFKTLAAAAGLVILPTVSRLAQRLQ